MSILDPLIATAHRRVGLPVPAEEDWQPADPALREALAALQIDDHLRAVELVLRAVGAVPEDVEGRVVQEAVLLRLESHLNRLDGEIEDETRLRNTARGGITLLHLHQERHRFARNPHLLRWTQAAALVIIGTMALSVTRFGLSPWIAAAGLATFVAGAAVLLRVDARRQATAHAVTTNAMQAEVAEEMQILRADIRLRTDHIDALTRERDALRQMGERLSGGPGDRPSRSP
jgi:hypothetical protein